MNNSRNGLISVYALKLKKFQVFYFPVSREIRTSLVSTSVLNKHIRRPKITVISGLKNGLKPSALRIILGAFYMQGVIYDR